VKPPPFDLPAAYTRERLMEKEEEMSRRMSRTYACCVSASGVEWN
jgi:hypothetical protein